MKPRAQLDLPLPAGEPGSVSPRSGQYAKSRGASGLVLAQGNAELELDPGNAELPFRQAERFESLGRLALGVAQDLEAPIQFVNEGVRYLRHATEDLLALLEKHRAVLSALQSGSGVEEAVARAAAAEADTDLAYLIDSMPKALGGCSDGLERILKAARSLKELAEPRAHELAEVDLNRAIENTLNPGPA